MRAAPALDCHACGKSIGKRRGHNLTEEHRVLCMTCLGDNRLHSSLWPDCPHLWHDNYDHVRSVAGTRAGVAAVLGVWP